MKITFPGGSRVDAEYKGFEIRTDQPVYLGGEGSYPAPFDYFLASIGTCAGIYVLNFLKQRNMLTEGVYMTMKTIKDRGKRMISKIVLEVFLPPEFPEKYKKAIVNSINLCAVKKHMEDPPEFETVLHIPCEEKVQN